MDSRNGSGWRIGSRAVASFAFGTGTAAAAPISSAHTEVLAQGYGGNGDGNGDGNDFDLNGLISPFLFGGRGSSGSAVRTPVGRRRDAAQWLRLHRGVGGDVRESGRERPRG